MCITPIIHIEITNILKVLWKFVHCVIIISIKVHLCAVGVVLCIEVISCVGTMGSECQGNLVGGRIKEVGKCVRVTRPGSNFTDPIGCRKIIRVNGIS